MNKNVKPDHCQNCNFKLNIKDNFCPNCGQKTLPDHLTFRFFFHEFINNIFSFDSRFLITIKNLLLKPAFLSYEFIHGRRITYINPIQLFFFASFLYFLVNSFMFLKEDIGNQDLIRIQDSDKNIINDSINIQQSDSLIIIQDGTNTDTLENSYVGEFLKKGQDFNNLDKETQNEKLSKSISYAVFLLMPLFALYLGWFFRKRRRHYLENIIFSLHFHAFFYLVGVLFLLFDKVLTGDIDTLMLNILVIVYLLLAVKKFYGFPWISTILRFLGLLLIYGLTVSIFLIASIILSVLV